MENLSCRRAGLPLFTPLSFTLKAGSLAVVTGTNGIGKSTLLRSIAGLHPAQGTVQGAESVCFIPQQPPLKTYLRVREQLDWWKAVYHADFAQQWALIENGWLDKPQHALSAGQRQRVSLCQLHITTARLWLLDEPTASLDTAATAVLLQMLQQHCASGGVVLMASHDPHIPLPHIPVPLHPFVPQQRVCAEAWQTW